MPKQKISKEDAKNKINDFFSALKDKNPKQINKIKKFAMKNRINLKKEKRLFCKKCLNHLLGSKIRIRNSFKVITCKNCGQIKRIRIKDIRENLDK